MMLLFISFPCTRTDMAAAAAPGVGGAAAHGDAPLHQQSKKAGEKEETTLILFSKVLEDVSNGRCMINKALYFQGNINYSVKKKICLTFMCDSANSFPVPCSAENASPPPPHADKLLKHLI